MGWWIHFEDTPSWWHVTRGHGTWNGYLCRVWFLGPLEIWFAPMLDVSSLTPAAVLMRLYNAASTPKGSFGALHDRPLHVATEAEAQAWLDRSPDRYFDWLGGRVLKADLSTYPQLDPRLYDRDNGQGAAARALGLKPES